MERIQEKLHVNRHLIPWLGLELGRIFLGFLSSVLISYFYKCGVFVFFFLSSLCTAIASIPSPPGQVPVACALRGEGVN